MPKLLFASPSPYSAKVRMAAAYAGIAVEAVPTNTGEEPEILLKNNPLGKIPVLLTDDGESLFDSRAIIQYLNRASKNALFPRNPAKRLEAERLEALADGICADLEPQRQHKRERRVRCGVGGGLAKVVEHLVEHRKHRVGVPRRGRQPFAHLREQIAAPATLGLLRSQQMRHHVPERRRHAVAITPSHSVAALRFERGLHFDGATPRPAADIVVEACQPLAAHELRAAHDNAVSDHCPGGNGDDSWHIAEPSRTDARRSYPAGHRHTGRCEETTAADAGEAAPATRRPAP